MLYILWFYWHLHLLYLSVCSHWTSSHFENGYDIIMRLYNACKRLQRSFILAHKFSRMKTACPFQLCLTWNKWLQPLRHVHSCSGIKFCCWVTNDWVYAAACQSSQRLSVRGPSTNPIVFLHPSQKKKKKWFNLNQSQHQAMKKKTVWQARPTQICMSGLLDGSFLVLLRE